MKPTSQAEDGDSRELVVQPISGTELTFAAVLELASRNKRTLGFLPDEAFRQRADRGTLLGLVGEGGRLAGYVLADLTNRGIVIRQLCVEEAHRGQGGARRLVDAVVDEWSDAPGISLLCRRDWPAANAWPRLGFAPVGERWGEDGIRCR